MFVEYETKKLHAFYRASVNIVNITQNIRAYHALQRVILYIVTASAERVFWSKPRVSVDRIINLQRIL